MRLRACFALAHSGADDGLGDAAPERRVGRSGENQRCVLASVCACARLRSFPGLMAARGHTEAPEAKEEGPRYASPPPGYPPICGAKARAMGIADNLMRSFVAMDALPAPLAEEVEGEDEGPGSTGSEVVRYGQVMDMDGFLHWLAGSPDAGA